MKWLSSEKGGLSDELSYGSLLEVGQDGSRQLEQQRFHPVQKGHLFCGCMLMVYNGTVDGRNPAITSWGW